MRFPRFQFSLAALFVFVTLCGIGAFVAQRMMDRPDPDRSRKALERLRELGCAGISNLGSSTHIPSWDDPKEPVHIMLTGETKEEDAIEAIGLMPDVDDRIRSVTIFAPGSGRNGWQWIGRVRGLKHIALYVATDLNDAGVATIASIPTLETLHLFRTGITNDGLKTLARNQSIRWLFIQESTLDDRSIESLARMSGLKELYITDDAGKVSPMALHKLSNLRHLESVHIVGISMSDIEWTRLRAALTGVEVDAGKVVPELAPRR